jgi:hypothetical protein
MIGLLDQSYWYVPLESSNGEVAAAFGSDDPSLLGCADRGPIVQVIPRVASEKWT